MYPSCDWQGLWKSCKGISKRNMHFTAQCNNPNCIRSVWTCGGGLHWKLPGACLLCVYIVNTRTRTVCVTSDTRSEALKVWHWLSRFGDSMTDIQRSIRWPQLSPQTVGKLSTHLSNETGRKQDHPWGQQHTWQGGPFSSRPRVLHP